MSFVSKEKKRKDAMLKAMADEYDGWRLFLPKAKCVTDHLSPLKNIIHVVKCPCPSFRTR
jgi:hypothetical protein